MTASQDDFFSIYPELGQYILDHDLDHLMDKTGPCYPEIDAVIRGLPEYSAYRNFVNCDDFNFGGFARSGVRTSSCGEEKSCSTDEDVKGFLLHRIKRNADRHPPFFGFVIRNEQDVIGYAGLFAQQIVGWDLQYERSVFIGPQYQSSGYGKECMIGLTRFAFEQLQADRVFTKVRPDNVKSRNNIERNFGAVYMGDIVFQDEPRRTYTIFPEAFYEAIKETHYRRHTRLNAA